MLCDTAETIGPTNNPKTNYIISSDIDITDSSNNDITNNNIKSSSSSSISIGAIIGIIAGGVVFIIAIIIIIYKCCGGPPSIPPNPTPTNQTQTTTIVHLTNNDDLKDSKIVEHKPQTDKDNPIKVIFVNQGFGISEILIDSKETINELIRFYFQINGRLDLYGDESIRFLNDGNCFMPPYPPTPVETLINKYVNSKTIRIIVDDNDNKMKK